MNVMYDGKTYEGDPGRTIKEAQQNAAGEALMQTGYYDDLMKLVPEQQVPEQQVTPKETKTPKKEFHGEASIFKCQNLGMQYLSDCGVEFSFF